MLQLHQGDYFNLYVAAPDANGDYRFLAAVSTYTAASRLQAGLGCAGMPLSSMLSCKQHHVELLLAVPV